jgi:hypothetical protein
VFGGDKGVVLAALFDPSDTSWIWWSKSGYLVPEFGLSSSCICVGVCTHSLLRNEGPIFTHAYLRPSDYGDMLSV